MMDEASPTVQREVEGALETDLQAVWNAYDTICSWYQMGPPRTHDELKRTLREFRTRRKLRNVTWVELRTTREDFETMVKVIKGKITLLQKARKRS